MLPVRGIAVVILVESRDWGVLVEFAEETPGLLSSAVEQSHHDEAVSRNTWRTPQTTALVHDGQGQSNLLPLVKQVRVLLLR